MSRGATLLLGVEEAASLLLHPAAVATARSAAPTAATPVGLIVGEA
jgi:hypothetical protein